MDFETASERYQQLKAAYEAGEIDAAHFEEAVYRLSLVDAEGSAWQIGLTTGAWYRKVGSTWVEDVPPGSAAAAGAVIAPMAGPAPPTRSGYVSLPMWAVTLLALGAVVTILGVLTAITFIGINRRPAPVAVVRTMVVYTDDTATPTTTMAPTRTPRETFTEMPELEETPEPDETEDPFPTITLLPTTTITPRPNPGSLLPISVWKRLSWTNFDRLENVRGEWRTTFDDNREYELAEFQFQNYRGLNSAYFKYFSEFIDIVMDPQDEDLVLRDIEIEEMIAFRPGSEAGYLDIMCRFNEWIFTYAFSVDARNWTLMRFNDDQEVSLANGQMPATFRNGDWGRIRMRCVGDTISVWHNSLLLVSVRDNTHPTGQWAMTLYLNDATSEADIYLNSHRVYYQRNDVALVGDMVQVGDLFVTLDSGWRREGSRYSLGLWVENRSGNAVSIDADQVYLQRPDGSRITTDANPGEGNAYQFPFSVRESMRTGNLYFNALTANDIDRGLQLVVDLSSDGLNEIRFQLPVE